RARARSRMATARGRAESAALTSRRRLRSRRDRGNYRYQPRRAPGAAASGAAEPCSPPARRRPDASSVNPNGNESMNCQDISLLLDDGDIHNLTEAQHAAAEAHLA